MTTASIARPATGEYGAYYDRYISLLTDDDVLRALHAAPFSRLVSGLQEAQGGVRYAPDKWSIKESIGHVSDTERIFAYRALRVARNDATPLAGFEQDDYVRAANFESRTVASLAAELDAVRAATIALFEGLSAEELARRGTASGSPLTPRAVAFMIAGHELHHVELFRARYKPLL